MTGRRSRYTAAAALAGLLLAGCAAPGRRPAVPEPRQPRARRSSAQAPAGARSGGSITLEQALAEALRGNPALMAQAHDLRAAGARSLQAGVLPNPELAFEVEEYDRDGRGFESAETAVVLAQVFELGGKRRWRKRAAEVEREMAGWAYESKRLDVVAETARRFVDVLAAQQRLHLAGSAVELARKTSEAVAERVKAGKAPPLQASKSGAELEIARLNALDAENALAVARGKLAAMWGSETALFETAEGSLERVPDAVPRIEDLRAGLAASPDLARWDAQRRRCRAALASEKAARIPDLKASVGFRQYEEDGTDGFAFGVGMPLPLFDRNRANIAAARHELAKAESELTATQVALAAELAEAHAALTAAHQRVAALRAAVVPAMEQAYVAAHEGYRQGKFGFLDMMDAQRGLFEVRASLVDALSAYQAALIAVRRIAATGIDDLQRAEEEDEKHETD